MDPIKAIVTRRNLGSVTVSTIPFTHTPWILGEKSSTYLNNVSFSFFFSSQSTICQSTMNIDDAKWYTMLEQLDVYRKTVKALTEGPIIIGEINDSDGNHTALRNWATHQRNLYTQSKPAYQKNKTSSK